MIYNVVDGNVLSVTQEFLDDEDVAQIALAGYPKLRLYDEHKAVLSSTSAAPSQTPGQWVANVTIPNLDIDARVELRLVWVFKSVDLHVTKITDSVLVSPKVDRRESDVIGLWGDPTFSLTLPTHFGAQDRGAYQAYLNNAPVLPMPGNLHSGEVSGTMDSTSFVLPLVFPHPSMQSALLKVDITPKGGTLRSYLYKLWVITPQIMLAMNHLEGFLNKSRIENTIPELRYTPGDLIYYLERGLYLFNSVGALSTWNGMNMQGVLFDGWVTCSCYYALGAQLLAEGSLSFDFSGQGISLNVDRTPQLDSALGRIESAISDKIMPMKAKLAKQGLRSGDGSVGARSLNVPSSHGTLGIINAPTTHLPFGVPIFTGRRY